MTNPYIISNENGWLKIGGVKNFSVFRTFDCGQCFRFNFSKNPEHKNQVDGVAFSKAVSFADSDNSDEFFIKSTPEDFENIWSAYLCLDMDYDEIDRMIISAPITGAGMEHMKKAAEVSRGIRILRQDKWETICSFIISQNNNIPRIKKIVENMCKAYGSPIEGGYAFPTAEALASIGENAIFDLKVGFRAKYIYDAAVKISSGEISLDDISNSKTYDDAAQILYKIKGIGPKVAACSLLFGFSRFEAFPVDVWIKRVITNHFPDGLDPKVFGEYAGIAQQYLFYCERFT